MMYKTVIEVVSEAPDPIEAADIAGEYLRGCIESGVSMRCRTGSVVLGYVRLALVSMAAFAVIVSLAAFVCGR